MWHPPPPPPPPQSVVAVGNGVGLSVAIGVALSVVLGVGTGVALSVATGVGSTTSNVPCDKLTSKVYLILLSSGCAMTRGFRT